MKRIKYIVLRRLTFSIYLLITVCFCLLLSYMGKEEIRKAELYAEKEKKYVTLLISCRAAMNSCEHSFNKLQSNAAQNDVTTFLHKVILLRKSVNLLTFHETKRTTRSFMPNSELKSHTTALFSAARTLPIDIAAPKPEIPILLKDDTTEIAERMNIIRMELHERFKVELDYVENWRNQSLFFFEKLEIHLVYYFVLTTLFITASFILSGNVLRRYLGLLSQGAHEISSGKLDYRFKDTTDDVIGDVMRDFDFMAQQLQQQTQTLKNINSELLNKAAELQDANEHKDRFLANMSHELRTPLNAIIGFSDLIMVMIKRNTERNTKISTEKIKNHTHKILNAAEHLLELISDLLEIAKVDAGVLTLEYTDFDLNKLSKNVIEMLQPIADKKELTLSMELKNNTVPIYADRRLMRQVLINLLNNALKFTSEGFVKLTIASTEKEILITVTDTGIGISEKDAKLIFKDFHRVEQGLTSNYEGVGLGLTLTKRIVELHNGTIKVESKLKRGSIFTVTLPLEHKDKL